MDSRTAYTLLRTDILLGTSMNCYNTLIDMNYKIKIMKERMIPCCSVCSNKINFYFDNYLDNNTDEYSCSICYSRSNKKDKTKWLSLNMHFHDYRIK